jgi:hypothetical protein
MNRNVEQGLVTIRSMMRDTQEAFDDLVNQWKRSLTPNHATIAAKNALEMSDKLCQALAYYYTPTVEEYQQFDEHCEAVSAAGGCPPDPESHWSEVAFNRWEYQQNE